MARFRNNRFVLISTPELKCPDYVTSALSENGNSFVEVKTIEECISELDILYMTRIQRERFASKEEYARQAGVYRLTAEKMKLAKPDMAVLHPLPKVDEIDYEVDDDPRTMYFEQAENGMYIRMALIAKLCEHEKTGRSPAYPKPEGAYCNNPRCISNHEKYLPKLIKDGRCEYCDHGC